MELVQIAMLRNCYECSFGVVYRVPREDLVQLNGEQAGGLLA